MPIQFLSRTATLFMVIAFASIFQTTMAQEALKPRLSPLAMTTFKYDDTYVKVTYCRPHIRDREVFGNIVPFGEVWRTGANEATEITITEDIQIDGHPVKAGTYTLFTIPGKEKWTIILNIELGQWGAFDYNPDKNILTFDVPVQKTDVVYEPFTINFANKGEVVTLQLMWNTTMVEIPITFD